MQQKLTDTPGRWDSQGSSYFVSAGSMRPEGWLPWVGEEPPRSHVLNESGRKCVELGSAPTSLLAEFSSTDVIREVCPSSRGESRLVEWGNETECALSQGWLHLRPRDDCYEVMWPPWSQEFGVFEVS